MQTHTTHLRSLYIGIVIGKTNGETFASSGLFQGGIFGRVPSSPHSVTASTPISIASTYELTKWSSFLEFLRSLGEKRPRCRMGQIAWFLRNHPWAFGMDGFSNFFEMTSGEVADVRHITDTKVFKVTVFRPEITIGPWADWCGHRVHMVSPV